MAEPQHSQWSGKTDGTPFMQRALIWIIGHVSIRVPYAFVAVVVPFYMLFHREGYRAIYAFMRQRMGYKPLTAFLNVYRNHCAFGKVVIDRFAAYAGRKFSFTMQGTEVFDRLSDGNEGFVTLSSHTGCFEMSGYTMKPHKKMNVIVYGGETETVMRNRGRQFGLNNINMIMVSSDMAHLFEINAALNRGEIVSLPADRLFGSAKYIECDFFGGKAKFPAGAFTLAKAKGSKTVAVFAMKTATYQYHLIMKEVDGAQQYADTLEEVVRQYPLQWFNFFDFWNEQ